MDYEKKYKEALETARRINSGEGIPIQDGWTPYEAIFPELVAESEDEKIRKDIVSLVNEFWERIGSINPEYSSRSRMLTWLEKQGEQKLNHCNECINVKGCINCENGELRETEQKPADKVEPKFHEGEWITIKQ